jgi:hypothetical protein
MLSVHNKPHLYTMLSAFNVSNLYSSLAAKTKRCAVGSPLVQYFQQLRVDPLSDVCPSPRPLYAQTQSFLNCPKGSDEIGQVKPVNGDDVITTSISKGADFTSAAATGMN